MAIDITDQGLQELLKKYIMYKTGGDIAEGAAKHYLYPDKNEDLQRKSMQLDILMKQKQLGFPLDDDAYEAMINGEEEDHSKRNALLSAMMNKAKNLPLPSSAYMRYNPSYIPKLQAAFKEATYVPTSDWPSIATSGSSALKRLFGRIA